MLDNIGGDKVVSAAVAVWDGKQAVRDKASGLETTFTLFDRASGGQIRATSDVGNIAAELPGSGTVPLAGSGSARTGGKNYRVAWVVERIGPMVKLSYTITETPS
jgi:hypothetical protein